MKAILAALLLVSCAGTAAQDPDSVPRTTVIVTITTELPGTVIPAGVQITIHGALFELLADTTSVSAGALTWSPGESFRAGEVINHAGWLMLCQQDGSSADREPELSLGQISPMDGTTRWLALGYAPGYGHGYVNAAFGSADDVDVAPGDFAALYPWPHAESTGVTSAVVVVPAEHPQ
jgi:hypothetical protein